jgi:hypothetical protein
MFYFSLIFNFIIIYRKTPNKLLPLIIPRRGKFFNVFFIKNGKFFPYLGKKYPFFGLRKKIEKNILPEIVKNAILVHFIIENKFGKGVLRGVIGSFGLSFRKARGFIRSFTLNRK